jgi:hypothetical protein
VINSGVYSSINYSFLERHARYNFAKQLGIARASAAFPYLDGKE